MGTRGSWEEATENGALKVSGGGRDPHKVTLHVTEYGGGYGPSERLDVTASVEVSLEDWNAIVEAVTRHTRK